MFRIRRPNTLLPHISVFLLMHGPQGEDGRMLNYVMAIRYQDRFVRTDGGWRFRERVLATDWTEDRPVEALV